MIRSSSVSFLCLVLAACGDPAASHAPAAKANPELQKLVLATDPGEAAGVVDAKVAGAKDRVVVLGRIGSITPGRAQFTMMDIEMPYCGETNLEDKCPTPWDYCCEGKDRITRNSLVVEVHDAAGKTFATPALPDLRLVDKVKVTGKVTKDEYGNVLLIATGLFRVERPKLPDYVKWPQ